MRLSGLAALPLAIGLLAWGFAVLADDRPGWFVGALVLLVFGLGPTYGAPSEGFVSRPWRNHPLRRTARLLGARALSRRLDRAGWNRQVRSAVRSRNDLDELRTDSVAALVSHSISTLLHLAATVALVAVGHPWWGVVAAALGLLVHAWPALLQIDVLGRVDALQTRIRRQ